MGKGFCALFKKDCRMLVSGKFFLMAVGFLALYTAYVNLGYIRFMQMPPYNVYLYDPAGTQTEVSSLVHAVASLEAMDADLLSDTNGVGLDTSAETVRVVLYAGAEHVDLHRADYALSLLRSSTGSAPEIIGTNTPEQKVRKEITCELLFFELAAVGFWGIAAVLFKEKSMGVIRVHAILPVRKDLFLLSKLAGVPALRSGLCSVACPAERRADRRSGGAARSLAPDGHPVADDGSGGPTLRPAAEGLPSIHIGLFDYRYFCGNTCIFVRQYIGEIRLD